MLFSANKAYDEVSGYIIDIEFNVTFFWKVILYAGRRIERVWMVLVQLQR